VPRWQSKFVPEPNIDRRIGQHKELIMKSLIGAAVVAGALALAGSAAIRPADAATSKIVAAKAAASGATDVSARRRHYRRYQYGYRPYCRPYSYYGRPYYYRPYPYYAPAPFTFGFGFGPYW
jgi:hypothetical protein